MALALLKSGTSRSDVEVAWATYRALIIAECDDPRLQEDPQHQLATSLAKHKFERLYLDWTNN